MIVLFVRSRIYLIKLYINFNIKITMATRVKDWI